MKRHSLLRAIATVGILAVVAVAIVRPSTLGTPEGVAATASAAFAAVRRWLDGEHIQLTTTQLVAAAALAWLVFVLSLILLARSGPNKPRPLARRLDVANATTLPDVSRHQHVQATEAIPHVVPTLPVRPVPRDGALVKQEATPEAVGGRAANGLAAAPVASKRVDAQQTEPGNQAVNAGGMNAGGAVGERQGHVLALAGVSAAHEHVRRYGLFVVAEDTGIARTDGVSGEASRRALEVIAEQMVPVLISDQALGNAQCSALLEMAVMRARIDARQQSVRMVTDLDAAIAGAMVIGGVAHVVNVGACRMFIFRAGDGLLQITTDPVATSRPAGEGQAAAGLVASDPARGQARRDQIDSHAEDDQAAAEVDVLEVDVYPDDLLLLCSPGLWQALPSSQIEAILRAATDPRGAAELLTRAGASHTGKHDFSVIVVRPLGNWMAEFGIAASGAYKP